MEVRCGKDTVIMTDSKQKVNDRIKYLRKNRFKVKTDKVRYFIRKTDKIEKYKKSSVGGGGGCFGDNGKPKMV